MRGPHPRTRQRHAAPESGAYQALGLGHFAACFELSNRVIAHDAVIKNLGFTSVRRCTVSAGLRKQSALYGKRLSCGPVVEKPGSPCVALARTDPRSSRGDDRICRAVAGNQFDHLNQFNEVLVWLAMRDGLPAS